jgi:hypothetical protein
MAPDVDRLGAGLSNEPESGFPVVRRKFPVPAQIIPCSCFKIPCSLESGISTKTSEKKGFFVCETSLGRQESQKFPVFSLVIREFDTETGSRLTASSANESSGFRDSLLSCVKNAHLAGNPGLQVHRRIAHVGVQTRVLENSLCLHFWLRMRAMASAPFRSQLTNKGHLAYRTNNRSPESTIARY